MERRCEGVQMGEIGIVLEDGTKMWEIRVRQGESLMQAMRREGFLANAVCGGNGRCGKCGVLVREGNASVSAKDRQFFQKKELEDGWRLACTLFPAEQLRLSWRQPESQSFEILAEFHGNAAKKREQNTDCDPHPDWKTGTYRAERFPADDDPHPDWKTGAYRMERFPAGGGLGPEGKMSARGEDRLPSAGSGLQPDEKTGTFCVAVDIGTTTLALALLEEGGKTANGGKNQSESPLHAVTLLNSQRSYGADVISRIQQSVAGQGRALQTCIQRDLRQGLGQLTEEYGIVLDAVRRIAISANTAMLHLLMGYECDTLGVYPFTPVNVDRIQANGGLLEGNGAYAGKETSSKGKAALENDVRPELVKQTENGQEKHSISWEKIKVDLLPGVSTFVGADIVAGMSACGFGECEEVCLLVDLGTNGEMALGNWERILVASTAAGPAFEGGNIAWGIGSVRGAICSVIIEGGRAAVRTIQDAPPVGICGTGVVETTAELLRTGLLDETGLLAEAYFEEGFPLARTAEGKQISFTQKDVREFQLAKAAVRAGIETLLARYGISAKQVVRIYLAGGFGYRLDWRKAMAIGMLPDGFSGRIHAVGNAALAGTAGYLQSKKGEESALFLPGICEEVPLATDAYFNELYLQHMMF